MKKWEYKGVIYENCRGFTKDGKPCNNAAKVGTFENGLCSKHAQQGVHPTLLESAECECGGKYYHPNCKLVYRVQQSG